MRQEALVAIKVWLVLLALLALTVALATVVQLGPMRPVASLGIAMAKTLLVAWFYMHLREMRGVNRLAAAAALVWLTIMFILTFSDLLTRHAP